MSRRIGALVWVVASAAVAMGDGENWETRVQSLQYASIKRERAVLGGETITGVELRGETPDRALVVLLQLTARTRIELKKDHAVTLVRGFPVLADRGRHEMKHAWFSVDFEDKALKDGGLSILYLFIGEHQGLYLNSSKDVTMAKGSQVLVLFAYDLPEDVSLPKNSELTLELPGFESLRLKVPSLKADTVLRRKE